MAMCEKCNTKGYEPSQMYIDWDDKSFVGPCCTGKVRNLRSLPSAQVAILPARQDDVEYGVELSNKVGVKAFVRMGGLDVSFERSPKQLKTWAEESGLIEKKTA